MDRHELDALRQWLLRRGITLDVAEPGSALGDAQLTLPGGLQLQFAATEPAPLTPELPADDYRALAEHAGDLLIAVDPDLVVRYASPAAEALLGWAPGELADRTLAELLVAEECAAFIARHFVSAGSQGDSAPDVFRMRRRDGNTLWMEARVAPLPAGSRLGRYVVSLRDASRRKQAEEALAAANQALATLATTDALTELANRRAFDNALRREWFRAQRDARPLAVLMVDIDHFKSLNDQYGHPVGDACLARVAKCLQGLVQRAGDLAARYGGEEFAVVLPNTDAERALALGERVRQAVATTAMTDLLGTGRTLSVSVGVACRVPSAAQAAEQLLGAADAALYLAKQRGRNRVELAAG